MMTVPDLQGAYFVTTGLWPVLHLRSFEAISGPKKERWLVKTFGLLIAAMGGALLVGARSRPLSAETRFLGIASAIGFIAADTYYAGIRRRISPVYLADAVAELGLLAAWLRANRVRAPKRETALPSP